MTSLINLDKYGSIFQQKVIGLLLTDNKFLINISDSLDSNYFENVSRKWIVDKTLEYFNEWHTIPTMDHMNILTKHEDNEVLRVSIREELKQSYQYSDTTDAGAVEKSFTEFCRNQKMKKAIITSAALLHEARFDEIHSIISEAVKVGEEKYVGLDYNLDIESRYRDTRSAIGTPWTEINDLTQGGFGKGDLIIFFGGPGGGKTWAVISMAAYAASCGLNVVYYTLELGEHYVGKRIDANLTNIPMNDLYDHRDKVEEMVSNLKGRLIIKEYPPKRASLKTIEKHLDQLKNQNNFKVDLIIIDYLDLLHSKDSSKDKKDGIDDIYTNAKGLAKEYNVPVISPSQVNRAGAKDMVVEGDKAAGSYDKIMIADIIISTSRLKEDKKKGTSRWHIMKNRYGDDGITYNCEFDSSTGITTIIDMYDSENEEDSQSNKTGFTSQDKEIMQNVFFGLKKK